MTPFAPAERSPRRIVAWVAVTALLATGLVSTATSAAAPAAAAVVPPTDSETFQVSRAASGLSTDPSLTSDGQRVAFTSTAADLVAGDTNGVADVFVSVAEAGSNDPFAGAPTLVSVPDDSAGGGQANGPSSEPVSSADGRYVVFTSAATNLVTGGGASGRTSIYVRDTLLGTTVRVQTPAGEPNGSSYDPDVSDDGRYVVFTSEASDLAPGDTNGAADAFVADLDANGDGVHGDISITRFIGDSAPAGGSGQARISGNGGSVAFTAHQDALGAGSTPTQTSGDFVFVSTIGSIASGASLVASHAHSPTIDSTGMTFAFISDDGCDGEPTVIAATSESQIYYVALGTINTDRRVGYIAEPVISADGSHVVWTTTVPQYDYSAPASALGAPVIRSEGIGWWDAKTTVECSGILTPDWVDLAEGTQPSVSASGRTVAYAAAGPAASTVFAMDTHINEGLSVSSTQGQLVTPGFMTTVDIPTIPLSSLRGYASTIANAPIHKLPIHKLPIHKLPIHKLPIHKLLIAQSPIHKLPIHKLPIHKLDLPGGWDQVLAGSPFAGELVQSVTLDEVLAWAEATLAVGSGATDAEIAAATLIQSLTLGDLDIDDSGLDALTLASFVLGSAPLGKVGIAGPGAPLARWQALVDAQGLGVHVADDTVLADLDAAGLDVERSGVSDVPLNSLPIATTLLGDILMADLFLQGTPLGDLDVSSIDAATRIALFGTSDVSGPLAGVAGSFLPDATADDLAAGTPDSVTLGTLFMSMLSTDTYPWEQISPSSIDPNLVEASTEPNGCDEQLRCGRRVTFQFTFDPGPGEPATFAAPTATVTTPAGTVRYLDYFAGSGPDTSYRQFSTDVAPALSDGGRTRYSLPQTAGGTVLSILTWYTATTQPGDSQATGELTSGALSASDSLSNDSPLATFDDPDHNLVGGVWQTGVRTYLQPSQIYYEWISPRTRGLNDEGKIIEGPAQDEDYYYVNPPPPGQRLVVSTNATDGQLSLSLYAPTSSDSTLGVADAGPAPGTPVTEQNGPANQSAESGADAGAEVLGQTLVDQAVVGGAGTAQVEAAAPDDGSADPLLIRVTSGNGRPSASLYSLRVQYLDDAPERHCTPWAAPQTADPGQQGVSDPVTGTTNTVFVFDEKRYGDIYGAQAASAVRDALVSLTGDGHVGAGKVDGAVLAVDTDPAVVAARTTLDENPCSISARRTLVAAINAFVSAQLGAQRAGVSSVVIVGGDDVIPFAPVAQNTSQFTEVSHAAELRLAKTLTGDPCPNDVVVDPCETPLSAAAAGSYILTDDAYGLAKAYDSLGGHLYVPTVALGRLTDGPDQIIATVGRFLESDGILTADSTLTGGYGAWAELPQQVTQGLAWRSPVNVQLPGEWDAAALQDAIFPAAGASPRVVSVNTHADETRMLPAIPGAESGDFTDSELFTAAGHDGAAQLAGALVFGIGCHAGNNLPYSYYGDTTDWVDVFSQAGGYVGNTGYGLASDVTTALGERLLSLYADWMGVSVDGTAVSASGALTYAKQSYLGGLGLYSGYDEKALMEAVYYGLPMYTFANATKSAPLPEMPDLTVSTHDGLTSAGLSFHPSFQQQTGTDEAGNTVEYLTANSQAPATPAGQPILPSIVTALEPPPAGLVARGAVFTALTSEIDDEGRPAVTAASVGVPESTVPRSGVAFPSTFATITKQDTPSGPLDLLVVTPARVESTRDGVGYTERFTDFDLEVVYGDAASTDTTAPTIDSVDLQRIGGGEMQIRASDTESGIASIVLLVQPDGETAWQRAIVKKSSLEDGTWTAEVPPRFRWMLQVVDGAGNVTTDTARGRLDLAGASAPTLGDPGPDVTVSVGDRLLRAVEVTDAVPGDSMTASVALTRTGGDTVSSSPATVVTGADGTTRALIDQPVPLAGSFTLTLSVCRGNSCTSTSFDVETPPLDQPPTATVRLKANDVPAEPTSILTAEATLSDPDGDEPGVAFEWFRNGIAIPGATAPTLALAGLAQTDDLIRVTATPTAGGVVGHAASAEILIGEPVTEPAAPSITATATTAGGPYPPGDWSRTPVTVSFVCTSGAPVTSCPPTQVLTDDTTSLGTTVRGSMTDLLGRTATADVLVRIDATGPALAPVVTPDPVVLDEAALATPHATDAASGVASESCDAPDTSVLGAATVQCRAVDDAGNETTAAAPFTVVAPAAPEITITATDSAGAYIAGSWSRTPVHVTFTCTSGVAVTDCPAAQTIDADTTGAGVTVAGTMTDALGRTAPASIVVRVDGTAPSLDPTVEPSSVTVGGTAVAAAHATDLGSGVATQSCDTPDTTAAGPATVECRATDFAGNSATAVAGYTVKAPTPTATRTPTPAPTPTPTPRVTPTPRPPAVSAPRTGPFAAPAVPLPQPLPQPLPALTNPLVPLPDRTALGAVEADGSSVFAHGAGVPVVFRALSPDGRSAIGTAGFVRAVTEVAAESLPGAAAVTEAWFLPFPAFVYVPAASVWIGSIPTGDLEAGRKYTYRVDLSDGSSFTLTFGVR